MPEHALIAACSGMGWFAGGPSWWAGYPQGAWECTNTQHALALGHVFNHRRRINMRAAICTKAEFSSVTAVAHLEVRFGFTLEQCEQRLFDLHDAAVRATGHFLTVRAVTYHDSSGVCLGLKGDGSTMARTVKRDGIGHLIFLIGLKPNFPASVSSDQEATCVMANQVSVIWPSPEAQEHGIFPFEQTKAANRTFAVHSLYNTQ